MLIDSSPHTFVCTQLTRQCLPPNTCLFSPALPAMCWSRGGKGRFRFHLRLAFPALTAAVCLLL